MSKKKREKRLKARNRALLKKESRRQQTPDIFPSEMMSLFDRPAFGDIKAPKGFRTVTMTQGLSEFSEPLMEHCPSGEIDDLNAVMNLGVTIWNYTNPKVTIQPPEEEIIDLIAETLQMDETDAADLFEEMVQRKEYLFPADIQPENPMTMFMRKEVDYLIARFDEAQLNLSETTIPPNQADQKMLDSLSRLDDMLAEGEEYDDWEDLYFSVEQACCDQYFEWLKAKGAPQEHCQRFPFCIQTYFDFVYRYNGEGILSIDDFDLEDFFMDHLLRKVVIKPNEYVYWPPALRLFYTFLAEKGYFDEPERFIEMFYAIEPEFIEVLKEH